MPIFPVVSIPHFKGQGKVQVSARPERKFDPMKQSKKGHQRSRLRVDPFTLLQLLTEQDCTMSELQQRTGFDPAEMKALRAARSIRLDTLNRLSAGLNVPPNSLLITPDSPWTVNHCDSQTQEYGFEDAFHLIVDYSPYYEAPLFK